MEIILSVLLLLSLIYGVGITYIGLRIYKERYKDQENFVLGLNSDINEFKKTIDNLTKSNILVYDETVFEIMRNCKSMKSKIDAYMSKYDEYAQYIYTEDVDAEEQKKEVIGVLHASPNRK